MTSNPAAFILVQDKVGYKNVNVVKHKVKMIFGSPRSSFHFGQGQLLKDYYHDD